MKKRTYDTLKRYLPGMDFFVDLFMSAVATVVVASWCGILLGCLPWILSRWYFGLALVVAYCIGRDSMRHEINATREG